MFNSEVLQETVSPYFVAHTMDLGFDAAHAVGFGHILTEPWSVVTAPLGGEPWEISFDSVVQSMLRTWRFEG